jgi:hypothetical protein
LNPLLLQILSKELRDALLFSKLSHVSQSSAETVELSLYHPDHPHQVLVVSLLPQKPLVFFKGEKRAALLKPPNFCRSLRKHLEYAQLISVDSTPGERILNFGFKTPGGIFRLVFEGIPKYPNLILVGPDGKILSAIHYKNEVDRPVIPLEPYRPPPQDKSKPDFWALDPGLLPSLWGKAGNPPLGFWIKDQFRGTDPELASHLESFGDTAFLEWKKIKETAADGKWGGVVLFYGPPP